MDPLNTQQENQLDFYGQEPIATEPLSPPSEPFNLGTEDKIETAELKAPNVTPEQLVQEAEKPSFGETLNANVRLSVPYNTIRRTHEAIQDAFTQQLEGESAYRALDDPLMNFAHPDDRPDLSSVKSHEQLSRGILDREEQREARRIREESGFWANMGANAIANAWTFILPGLAIESQITRGAGLLYGAGAAALSAGAEAVVEQGALYGLIETQTKEETAENVAAQTIVAGLFGGTIGLAVSIPGKEALRSAGASIKGFEQQFRVNNKGIIEAVEVVDKSNGTQKYLGDITDSTEPQGTPENPFPGRTVQGEGLHQEFSIKGFGPASPFIWTGANWARNPFLLAKESPSLTVQSVANDFYTSNFRLNKTAIDGITPQPSLQEIVNRAQGETIQTSDLINKAYNEYIGLTPKTVDSPTLTGLIRAPVQQAKNQLIRPGLMSKAEFNAELYRGIVADGHDDPFISAKAKQINEQSNKVISERLKEKGYSVPDSPYGAVNHLTRRYDNVGILADQPNKVATLEGWFGETNQQIAAIRAPIRELEEKIARLEKIPQESEAAAKLKFQLEEMNAQIQRNIDEGLYDASLLVSRNGKKELGQVLTKEQIQASAYKTFLNITQTAPDILAHQTASAIKSGTSAATLTEARVLLRKDLDLLDAGFLKTDVLQNISTKNIYAHRLIAVDDWFKKAGWDGQQNQKEYLTQLITNDYKVIQQQVIDKFAKKLAENPLDAEKIRLQQGRALLKIDKRKKLDTSIALTAYERISGAYELNNGTAIRNMRVLKKWGYATQLLANIIPGSNDIVSGIANHGLANYVTKGATPYLLDLATFWKGGNARFKAQMRHFAIGIETELAINGQKMANNLEYVGSMQRIEGALDVAARAGQVAGGAALLGDWARNINARVSVGMLIRDLKAWQKGKLSNRGVRRLQDGRFDPDRLIDGQKLGDVVLNEFNTHGERIGFANLPNVQLWGNAVAQQEVERLTKNEVNRVVFAGNNPASFPQGLDPHGIGSGFFMYMGYAFQAINNFTIPFLQNIKDPEKLQGVIALLAVSALHDPIRKIVRGEELTEEDFEPKSMLLKAIQNSGLTGAVGEYFNRLNAIFDFVPSLQTNKHKYHRTLGELVIGPAGSLAENTGNVSAALINNEWNKTDTARLQKIVPLLNLIWFRSELNNYVEQLDLPKTRANARALNE